MKYPKVQIIIDILSRVDDSENSKMGFDMRVGNPRKGNSHHPCGTACCIGGWANRALRLVEGGGNRDLDKALSELTDIPKTDSLSICYPDDVDWGGISIKTAVKCLKRYRDTGIVDWIKAGAKVL